MKFNEHTTCPCITQMSLARASHKYVTLRFFIYKTWWPFTCQWAHYHLNDCYVLMVLDNFILPCNQNIFISCFWVIIFLLRMIKHLSSLLRVLGKNLIVILLCIYNRSYLDIFFWLFIFWQCHLFIIILFPVWVFLPLCCVW